MMSEYLRRYSRKRQSNCLRRGTIVTTTLHTRHRLGVDTQAHNSPGGNQRIDDGGGVVVLLVLIRLASQGFTAEGRTLMMR